MLRQIQYFQAVVRNNSFSEAAEECHISQSAISQQIKALEQELGFSLLERHNRKFVLTPAGEHFYKKSLVLVSDYEQMCSEAAKIARGDEAILKIGYLRSHSSPESRISASSSSRFFGSPWKSWLSNREKNPFLLLIVSLLCELSSLMASYGFSC